MPFNIGRERVMPFNYGDFEDRLSIRISEHIGRQVFVQITLEPNSDLYRIHMHDSLTLVVNYFVVGPGSIQNENGEGLINDIMKCFYDVSKKPKDIDHCIEVLSKALRG